MAAQQILVDQVYRCPDCGGDLRFEHRSWRCVDCGFVPNHAAD